ncbi:MAG: histone family protein [Candidatus Altiarchaeota archaeon]|nr:histone family protein [Candidatus Altiarchaeota archaeon]
MADIPLAPIERIMRRAGGDVRIGEEATKALRDYLEEIAEQVSEKASKFARHANRKTINGDDVKLATK